MLHKQYNGTPIPLENNVLAFIHAERLQTVCTGTVHVTGLDITVVSKQKQELKAELATTCYHLNKVGSCRDNGCVEY